MSNVWHPFKWEKNLNYLKKWASTNKVEEFSNCVFSIVFDTEKLCDAVSVMYFNSLDAPYHEVISYDQELLACFERIADFSNVKKYRKQFEKEIPYPFVYSQTMITIRPYGSTGLKFCNRIWFRHTGMTNHKSLD
jgi:hypothetical protein